MRKKGQLLGQPLVYVFALIFGALILAWGINSVMKLGDTAGAVELGKFATSLESKTGQYLNFDEGSTTTIKISLPSKISYVCFFDSQSPVNKCVMNEARTPCRIQDLDEGFSALTKTKTKYNIFFLPINSYNLPPKEIKNLKVDTEIGNPICYTNKAGNEFMITSMGTYVSVS